MIYEKLDICKRLAESLRLTKVDIDNSVNNEFRLGKLMQQQELLMKKLKSIVQLRARTYGRGSFEDTVQLLLENEKDELKYIEPTLREYRVQLEIVGEFEKCNKLVKLMKKHVPAYDELGPPTSGIF